MSGADGKAALVAATAPFMTALMALTSFQSAGGPGFADTNCLNVSDCSQKIEVGILPQRLRARECLLVRASLESEAWLRVQSRLQAGIRGQKDDLYVALSISYLL